MTIKKDDVEGVEDESIQKEGLFSRVKCCGGRSSKTKTMSLHCWEKWFQRNCGLVSDGGRSQVVELMREEMSRRVPMPVLFYYIRLASSIPFVCI